MEFAVSFLESSFVAFFPSDIATSARLESCFAENLTILHEAELVALIPCKTVLST